jgi:calpain-15
MSGDHNIDADIREAIRRSQTESSEKWTCSFCACRNPSPRNVCTTCSKPRSGNSNLPIGVIDLTDDNSIADRTIGTASDIPAAVPVNEPRSLLSHADALGTRMVEELQALFGGSDRQWVVIGVDKQPWACQQCTFDNNPHNTTCAACGSARGTSSAQIAGQIPRAEPALGHTHPSAHRADLRSGTEVKQVTWNCTFCTVENTPDATVCYLCNGAKRPETEAPNQNHGSPSAAAGAPTHQRQVSNPHDRKQNSRPPLPPLSMLAQTLACPKCTFHNKLTANACEVCATPLPDSPPARVPEPSPTPSDTTADVDQKHRSTLVGDAITPMEAPTPMSPSGSSRWKCTACHHELPGSFIQCIVCGTRRAHVDAAFAASLIGQSNHDSDQDMLPVMLRRQSTVEDLKADGFRATELNESALIKQESRFAAELKETLTLLAGDPFIDVDFRPDTKSLFGSSDMTASALAYPDARVPPTAIWRRLHKIVPDGSGAPWCMLRDSISPRDIIQGELGDCYFISALSVLAERPELVLNLLLSRELNKEGVYKVRICKDGEWQVVTVDDSFPVRADHGRLAFARARGNQLWVSLLEKAYAKIHGSYASIVSGQVIEAFRDLTGAPCEKLRLHDEKSDPEMIWAQLLSFRQAGFLLAASCGRADGLVSTQRVDSELYERNGLTPDHAYSILDVHQLNNETKLLKLRNPWARGSFTGDYGPSSSKWTPELRDRLNFNESVESGVFWMKYDDFLMFFSSIDVCKLPARRHWYTGRIRGAFGGILRSGTHPKQACRQIFELQCEKPTWAYLTLHQPDLRGQPGCSFPYRFNDLGFVIVRLLETEKGFDPTLVRFESCKFPTTDRAISQEIVMQPGWRYIVVPFSFNSIGVPLEEFQAITLRLHTANEVMTKTHPYPRGGLLGRSLHLAVTSKCSGNALTPNVMLYSLHERESTWMLVTNGHPHDGFSMQNDTSASHGMRSSRGQLVARDIIPPLHSQLVCVLTVTDRHAGYNWKSRYRYGPCGNHHMLHEPSIGPGEDVHDPLPL